MGLTACHKNTKKFIHVHLQIKITFQFLQISENDVKYTQNLVNLANLFFLRFTFGNEIINWIYQLYIFTVLNMNRFGYRKCVIKMHEFICINNESYQCNHLLKRVRNTCKYIQRNLRCPWKLWFTVAEKTVLTDEVETNRYFFLKLKQYTLQISYWMSLSMLWVVIIFKDWDRYMYIYNLQYDWFF